MIFDLRRRNHRNQLGEASKGAEPLSLIDPSGWRLTAKGRSSPRAAMNLSAVNACVELISNSMAKLPVFIMDSKTKEHLTHPLLHVLAVRPNEVMTPAVYRKLMEANRLLKGNAYAWISRDPISAQPKELIPLPPEMVTPELDENGTLWYLFTHSRQGKTYKLSNADVLHYKGYSEDGIHGISVLERAVQTVRAAQAAQEYEERYYAAGTQLAGVLTTESDLKGKSRDKIREEWERIYAGPNNAFRTAVLDLGLKYQPVGINNRDSQFVESKAVSVEDIARFFGVPLYKINAGDQSYSSNEQNAIEYMTNTLHPIVCQYEEEETYKLLTPTEIAQSIEVRRNIMAELRGDNASRGAWYKTMREIGVFSVNDILGLEDAPAVAGGETRYASLNYIPLEDFVELSRNRNTGGEQKA